MLCLPGILIKYKTLQLSVVVLHSVVFALLWYSTILFLNNYENYCIDCSKSVTVKSNVKSNIPVSVSEEITPPHCYQRGAIVKKKTDCCYNDGVLLEEGSGSGMYYCSSNNGSPPIQVPIQLFQRVTSTFQRV